MKLQLNIDFSVDGKIPKGFDMDLLAQEIMKKVPAWVTSEEIDGSDDFAVSIDEITWDFMESDNEVKNILIKKKAKT